MTITTAATWIWFSRLRSICGREGAPLRRAGAAVASITLAVFLSACSGGTDEEPFDRTVPPVLGPPVPLTLPPVVSRELPNGLRLLMVEHRELPVVNFIMLVGSGPELDPPERLGLATLTAALLDEGTATRSALDIADQAAFLGATLTTGSGWDHSRVSLQTTTLQVDSALALFADVILSPSFPENELERLRGERLTSLLQMRDSPPQIAELEFARAVFGYAHPYGREQLGTERTVKLIARSDVEGYHRMHYRPNNSTLIVVGDIRPADMERRIARLFGEWERGERVRANFPPPPEPTGVEIHLIHKSGAPQTSVRIGHVGVSRSTSDFFPLVVVNTVLGGSFTSRLNMNLRESKGYTYGAGSRFEMRASEGPFVARSEVVAQSTDSALVEFLKELAAIRDSIPEEELDKARSFLQLQLPNAFEATGDIAQQLVPVALYGLPLDFYNVYAEKVSGVTRGDAWRGANSHIRADRLVVVLVGDRSVVEPLLRRLGLPFQVRPPSAG